MSGAVDKTHLGVNPYSTDGTDLKIVTWQRRQKGREGGGERGRGMRDGEEAKGREKGGERR